MGEVYRATDTNLNRQVAIKVLPGRWRPTPSRWPASTAKPRRWRRSTIRTSRVSTGWSGLTAFRLRGLRRYGATAFACWLLTAYPYLEPDDITAALPFAARQNDHPVPRSA